MNEFWDKILFRIGSFTVTPGKLAGIFAIFFITWIILFFFRRILFRNKQLSVSEKGTRTSFYQLVRYFLWVIAFSGVIAILGFNLTILVASSAALLVGIGFGLQNIFGDLVSGLFMLFERKVKVGDVMELDNMVGKVQEINLRTSVLLTRDGYNIIVPNHKFITENVINWSHQGFQRRFQVDVGVSYSSDAEKVSALLLQCAEEQEEVLKDEVHKPFVRFNDFGDSVLSFNLLFWTTDIFRVEQVKSDMRFRILKLFRKHNITIPFPQRDVHIIES